MELVTLDDLNIIKSEGVKEGEKWEFKSLWPSNEKIEETICAFANTSGGIILIGVDYNNTTDSIVGYPGIHKTRNLTERAINIGGNISPRVIPSSWLVDVGQDQVVQIIEVRKSRMIPHMASNGRFYFRAEKTNVHMPESLVEKLYMVRNAQREEATKLLADRKFFLRPTEKPWLSICYCPLYLENDLVVHSRDNLTFLNSLIPEINPNLINIFFRSTYYGYNFLIPATGNPIYLLEVYSHGLFVTGKLIEDSPAPQWDHLKSWFNISLEIYSKLIDKFKYPGFTRISLALNRMNNKSIVFENSRMNAMLVPPDLAEIILGQDFEDTEITGHVDNILKSFYIKLLAMHGLDDYIP